MIAAFAVLLIIVGVLNWLDYRREECELTDAAVRPGFRKPPQPRNFFRWYETYIVLFHRGVDRIPGVIHPNIYPASDEMI